MSDLTTLELWYVSIGLLYETHMHLVSKMPESFVKVSKGAKIRNRYNQVPHLTQDANGKVTNSQ